MLPHVYDGPAYCQSGTGKVLDLGRSAVRVEPDPRRNNDASVDGTSPERPGADVQERKRDGLHRCFVQCVNDDFGGRHAAAVRARVPRFCCELHAVLRRQQDTRRDAGALAVAEHDGHRDVGDPPIVVSVGRGCDRLAGEHVHAPDRGRYRCCRDRTYVERDRAGPRIGRQKRVQRRPEPPQVGAHRDVAGARVAERLAESGQACCALGRVLEPSRRTAVRHILFECLPRRAHIRVERLQRRRRIEIEVSVDFGRQNRLPRRGTRQPFRRCRERNRRPATARSASGHGLRRQSMADAPFRTSFKRTRVASASRAARDSTSSMARADASAAGAATGSIPHGRCCSGRRLG